VDLPEWGLSWGDPKVVNTGKGLRVLRSALPTKAFWVEWRRNKEGMRSKGYSLGRRGTDWEVLHWGIPTSAPEEPEEQAPAKTLPWVDPKGLLPYQVPAARALVAGLVHLGAALDSSDTGTGKTYTTLAAMRSLGLSPLVIVPKAIIPSWERAAVHLGIRIQVINYEKVRAGNTPYGEWKTETYGSRTYERFVWSPKVRALIFDEAHRAKGTKTQNAQLLIGAAFQKIPTIAASASCVTSPMDMRALGYLLGLHGLRDFYTWAEAHGCHKNRWDGWEFGGNEHDIQRIHAQIFPERGVRIRVSDLGDQFPKTMITTTLVDVQSPEKLSKAYADLDAAFKKIEEAKKDDKDGAEHLTAMLRARQVSETQKIPALIDMAKDALEEGRSVMIAVNFNDSLDTIAHALGKDRKVATIRGDQSAEERERNIQAFQTNKVHVIVINLRAGGVGVSLHDLHGRPRTALISPSWSAVDLKQALGRIWRAGGVSGSVQHILYARGTVEERVAEMLEAKLRRLTVFNDGLSSLDITDKDL
jgi:superfamily II DNA or RNA helicase